MLRLVFLAALLVACFALILAGYELSLRAGVVGAPLMLAGPLGLPFAYIYGFPAWIDRRRPASDVSRLKAYLEADGARVISANPDGVFSQMRYGPDYRNYVVRVRNPDGSEADRRVGVEVSVLAYPNVRDYDHPHRNDYRSG